MDSSPPTERPFPTDATSARRRGVVAVVVRERRFLVIRRSQWVAAPGMLCFPGGGVEPGETEHEAVVREMYEELACSVTPLRRLWTSVTRWNVELAWWLVRPIKLGEGAMGQGAADAAWSLTLNAAEVAEVHWLSAEELSGRHDLLESNGEFLAEWRRGGFELDA